MKSHFMYDPSPSIDSASDPTPCDEIANVECLYETLSYLLFKNQSLRFELAGARQKLMRIKNLMFGKDSKVLRQLIPADLLNDLDDLYKSTDEAMLTGPHKCYRA